MTSGEVLGIARRSIANDIGAPVGELAHADRPGAGMGQIEDDQVLQGRRCRLVWHGCSLALLCDDLAGAGLEVGWRCQHARHDFLQLPARDGIDLDPCGDRRLDEFRIAQRCLVGGAQRRTRSGGTFGAIAIGLPMASPATTRSMTRRSFSFRASSWTDGTSASSGSSISARSGPGD